LSVFYLAKLYRIFYYLWVKNSSRNCTVTRPYAGFRHPDQKSPDSMVRG
jgi:hypothetical protein